MRSNLETINQVLTSSTMDLDITLDELEELNDRLSAPVDFTSSVIVKYE